MSNYELKYFDVKGLGETTRLLFVVAGVPFTDTRIPLDVKTFDKPEFLAARALGEYDENMGRLPILVVDGKYTLGQSKSIEKYVARKLGFFGDNEEDAGHIDMLCEHVRDIRDKINALRAGKSPEELKEAVISFAHNDLGEWYEKFEKCPCVQGGGHFIGNRLSLADIVMHQLARDVFTGPEVSEAAEATLSRFPKIFASVHAVHEAAKNYLATRPHHPF